MQKTTWKQFKLYLESQGVRDEDIIEWIDTGIHPKSSRVVFSEPLPGQPRRFFVMEK